MVGRDKVYCDELQLITGIDIPIEELGITIRQPRLKEIAMIGEQNYFIALSIFQLTKEQLEIKDTDVTNWMLFEHSLNQPLEGIKNTRVLLTNFLKLFNDSLVIGPLSLIAHSGENIVNIMPEQFDLFQQIVGEVGGASILKPKEEEFNPADKRAAEIAEKMKKARKKLAAQQPQAKTEGFIARYVRALAIVTANSLEDIVNMTILQLNDLLQTYMNWESYDITIRSMLAGAKHEGKLQHWMVQKINEQKSSLATI